MRTDATLEPVGCSYYEPAALTDPRGLQISVGEWNKRRDELRRHGIRQPEEA